MLKSRKDSKWRRSACNHGEFYKWRIYVLLSSGCSIVGILSLPNCRSRSAAGKLFCKGPETKWVSPVAQWVTNLPAMPKTRVRSLGPKDPLEEEMATISSILVWEIPWTEESGRLLSKSCKELDTIEHRD